MKTANKDISAVRPPLPAWMRRRLRESEESLALKKVLREKNLHTVCQSAGCPNIGECFQKPTATFLILGNVCTRSCRFCGVQKGIGERLDENEPFRIAEAAALMKLKHVVITSVTRDDLEDGGAGHFSACVREIQKRMPGATVETLIPDFQGNFDSLRTVLESGVNILNHNVETVPELYHEVRPGADFERSVEILRRAREIRSGVITKSGLMLGLGESLESLQSVFARLSEAGCDAVTIGQYLPPSKESIPVKFFVSPSEFRRIHVLARQAGIRWVSAGPYVRSSYNAEALMRMAKEKNGE